jgi:uncharacterized protein involved in exopolysaccharide biosynthesis
MSESEEGQRSREQLIEARVRVQKQIEELASTHRGLPPRARQLRDELRIILREIDDELAELGGAEGSGSPE